MKTNSRLSCVCAQRCSRAGAVLPTGVDAVFSVVLYVRHLMLMRACHHAVSGRSGITRSPAKRKEKRSQTARRLEVDAKTVSATVAKCAAKTFDVV